MKKLTLWLAIAAVGAFITLLISTRRVAEARWSFRDETAVNAISVCRDGIYLGIGHEESPGPVYLNARLSGGQEVLVRVYNNLPATSEPEEGLAYSDYFLETWNEQYLPLPVGTEVTLAGLDTGGPTVRVVDCHLFPPGEAASGFSYQGMLYNGEQPAEGNYDLRFRLWDAASAGAPIGDVVTLNNVAVSEGVFNVKLNFGPTVFRTAETRWLEISVRPNGSGAAYTTLAPRQELLGAPYAHGLIPGAVVSGQSTEDPALTVENRFGTALQLGGGFEGLVIDHADRGVRVDSAGEHALSVGDASIGLLVESAIFSGIEISRTELTGVEIGSAGWNAISVEDAGANGVRIYSADDSGIVVDSAGQDGVAVFNAGDDGVYVGIAGNDGVAINQADNRGVVVENALLYGMEIEDGGVDAVRIVEAADDGIQIGDGISSPGYGLYTPSPGVDNTALLVNTADSLGEWALFTPDKIRAGNVTTSRLTQLAQVAAGTSLRAGDVVAVTGMAEGEMVGNGPLPVVQAADATHTGIIGVVETRLISQPAAGKDGENVLHSASGPASAGEYVALTIYGIAYVRVEEGVELSVGEQLTAADTTGRVRPLRTEELNGMLVSESAPTLGIVVDTAAPGELVPVFVTMR